MTIRIPVALRNTVLDLILDAIDAGAGHGTIEIRTGAQPATADTAASGSLLVTLTCEKPAFGSSSGGVGAIDAAPVLSAAATGSGTAGWARVKDSTGTTVFDGSVGTSGADFIIDTTTIVSGQIVTLDAGNLTNPV